MLLSRFERVAPWTGAVAGLAWIGQGLLFRIGPEDRPGSADTATIRDHLVQNHSAVGCLVIMGIALIFFASALRAHLRSGEAREATYSSVAYGGMVLMAAGLAQMVMWNWGLINGAAAANDDAALQILGTMSFFGFAGMGIGIATTLIATGLAGISNAVLPRWFGILTLILGVLSALGTAGVPPGGLVNYLLLPLWLITAAVIIARRQSDRRRTISSVDSRAT